MLSLEIILDVLMISFQKKVFSRITAWLLIALQGKLMYWGKIKGMIHHLHRMLEKLVIKLWEVNTMILL